MNLPDPQTRWRGVSRNVLLLGLVSFFTDISSDMIVPLLPAFLGTLGLGAVFLGWLEGVAETTAGLVKLFSGWWSDKLGRKKPLVIAGYSLSTLMRPAMAFAALGWHVFVVRFTDRVGKGVRTAPRDALVVASCVPEGRGRAFGFQRACDNAGAVIGPLMASMLLLAFAGSAEKYRWAFALALLPGLIAVALLFPVREQPEAVPPNSEFQNLKSKIADPPLPSSFKRYLVVVLLFTLGNSSDLFLLARAQALGVADVWLPTLWALLQAVKALTAWPGGILSDRVGRRPILVVGWLIYAAAYFGFAHATNALSLITLFALYGLFYGCTEPTERALVADFISERPDLRGTAFGWFNCAVSIGALPASVVFGWLYLRFGAETAFSVGAALALAAALGLLIFVRPPRWNPRSV